MRLFNIIFIILLIISISSSCKKVTDSAPIPEVEMRVPDNFVLSGIDASFMDKLVAEGDYIDYIFNDLPLSMNQDGQSSFYQDLRYISKEAIPGIPVGCKPMARKIYLGDGEILLEADLYFSDGCLFQIFIKDEKELFGNMLSTEGIQFYVKLLEQAQQSMPANLRTNSGVPQSSN